MRSFFKFIGRFVKKISSYSRTCKGLSGFFTGMLAVSLFLSLSVDYLHREFHAPGLSSEPVMVLINKNSALDEVGTTLVEKGVIQDRGFILWKVFSAGKALFARSSVIKAGEWNFEPNVSMAEAVEHMSSGTPVIHRITFPEGWTIEQIGARLNDDERLSGPFVLPSEEGMLMPDTYFFVRGQTREGLIREMTAAMERALEDSWDGRAENLPLSSLHDLLVLASIVEKETSKLKEKPHVAAVFLNRIKRGMRLEADPTVLYGIYGGSSWREKRRLTKAELASPTPYNTYRSVGLPPGPICNPGRASIKAVARPMKTNDLFFVADGSGGHTFSKTFSEHLRHVAKLRAIEAARAKK